MTALAFHGGEKTRLGGVVVVLSLTLIYVQKKNRNSNKLEKWLKGQTEQRRGDRRWGAGECRSGAGDPCWGPRECQAWMGKWLVARVYAGFVQGMWMKTPEFRCIG
jgi:hypothetical protein